MLTQNYATLTFADHNGQGLAWAVYEYYDCLEDALAVTRDFTIPWRVQVWIDIRNGPAEAGFWTDERYWIDGKDDTTPVWCDYCGINHPRDGRHKK